MKKTLWVNIVFWLHLPIVVIWFGLFLVPLSLWPEKITFHFWYITSLMALQFLWAIFVFHKRDVICPLTTLMQYLRGYPLASKGNYTHSYIAELIDRMGLKISYKLINVILLTSLLLVTFQYFFFN